MRALDELPWQVKTDTQGYSSIYGTNEDGGEGDLVAHAYGDHEKLLAAAPDLFSALETIASVLANPSKPGQAAYLIAIAELALGRARGEA